MQNIILCGFPYNTEHATAKTNVDNKNVVKYTYLNSIRCLRPKTPQSLRAPSVLYQNLSLASTTHRKMYRMPLIPHATTIVRVGLRAFFYLVVSNITSL